MLEYVFFLHLTISVMKFRNIALRGPDGSLSIALPRAERYSAEQWLRRDGDARRPGEATPGVFQCDLAACVAPAGDGLKLAYVMRRDALAEECWASDILITPLVVTTPCRTGLVIDLIDLRRKGPHALWFQPDGSIEVGTSAEWCGQRPWVNLGN